MTLKELKENLNKLPDYLNDKEVYLTQINEKGFGFGTPLDKIVYGSETHLWSNYHEKEELKQND